MIDLKRQGRPFAVGAAIVILAAMGVGEAARRGEQNVRRDREQAAAVERLSALRAAADARRDAELGAIRQLVGDYRVSASPAWRERLVQAIFDESHKAEVDPLIIAAIVAQESSFFSRARSHVGAVGLMQLRPFVAEDVARRREIDWSGIETLHDPALNVRLGIEYYKELLDTFEGDAQVALTAYNVGPTEVRRRLRAGTYRTSGYAREILARYARLAAERPDPVES